MKGMEEASTARYNELDAIRLKQIKELEEESKRIRDDLFAASQEEVAELKTHEQELQISIATLKQSVSDHKKQIEAMTRDSITSLSMAKKTVFLVVEKVL